MRLTTLHESDARVREAERKWKESGSPEDRTQYLETAVRARSLDPQDAKLYKELFRRNGPIAPEDTFIEWAVSNEHRQNFILGLAENYLSNAPDLDIDALFHGTQEQALQQYRMAVDANIQIPGKTPGGPRTWHGMIGCVHSLKWSKNYVGKKNPEGALWGIIVDLIITDKDALIDATLQFIANNA